MNLLNILLAVSIGIGTASAVEAKSNHHQNVDGEQIALKFFGGKTEDTSKAAEVKVVEASAQSTNVEVKKEEPKKVDEAKKLDEAKKADGAKKAEAKKEEDAKKDQAKKLEAAKKETVKQEEAKRDEEKKAQEKKEEARKEAAKKEAKEAKKAEKGNKKDVKADAKKIEATEAVKQNAEAAKQNAEAAKQNAEAAKQNAEAAKQNSEAAGENAKANETAESASEAAEGAKVDTGKAATNAEAAKDNVDAGAATNAQPAQEVVKEAPPVPARPAKPTIPIAKSKPADPSANDSMQMDSALMSVLRDIDKSIRENEEVNRIADPAQHAAVAAALNTLDIALDKASLKANRIVMPEGRDKLDKSLTAESWESGDLELPNGSHASLSVLWAKKVNGLVNISVTGNCGCHPNYAGERVGEWVVVLSGRSTLDKGFDIQSQSDVHFWLGKLTNFNVDATTCGEQISKGNKMPVLKALATEQRRKFLAEAAAAAKKPSKEEISSAAMPAPATVEIQRRTEAPAILQTVHFASPHAHLLVPKRAIAGEFITASVVDQNGRPEPFVELSFNDTKASTNGEGRVSFQVPEDAAVGPSLSVNLAGRDDASPEHIFIIQPLVRSSSTDVPRIDKWNVNRAENTITIEGHNFDGVATNNRVIFDARKEAIVRFSSPVELQAHVRDLTSGGHDVIVQRNGIRSEPISLSIIDPTPAISSKTKKKS